VKPNELLRLFGQTGALLKGHFELRSGLHSDEYFQCALLLREPRLAGRLCRALVRKMRAEMGPAFAVDAVIAPAIGGILVGYEIARILNTPSIFAEKQEGRLALRRGFQIRKDESFVVAEDVVTRGGRTQETIDIVRNAGGRVAAVAVLVDRSGGKARFACPFFSLLQMEPAAHDPKQCPLCRQGVPLDHPGS
jgi:orotate phosphoribosyltransferase